MRRYEKQLKIKFPGCKYVLTYTLDDLEDEIHVIQDGQNVLIHVLGNDSKNICKLKFKSGAAKEKDLKKMLKRFFAVVQKIKEEHPNIHIFISSCLPRFDGLDKLYNTLSGPEFVNAVVAKQYQNCKNVTLIHNVGMKEKYYDDDKYHLSSLGFERVMSHWAAAIGKVTVFLDLALGNS